jgi:hypothetical protein
MLRSFLSHSPRKFYEADKGDNPSGAESTSDDSVKTVKTFSQDELEAIVKDRLDRAKRKAKEDADKAKTEAEQKALAEQGEYKTLAEQRAAELANAHKELETAKTHEQAAEQYKKALLARLAVDKKSLPAGIVALLDKFDPLDQAEWLSDPKNAEALKPTSTDRTLGTPPRNGLPAARNTNAPANPNTRDDVDRPRHTLG